MTNLLIRIRLDWIFRKRAFDLRLRLSPLIVVNELQLYASPIHKIIRTFEFECFTWYSN